jgi:RHS repeat-associated protein
LAASPTYDDDGNLTSDGTWRYVWNGENRLVQMRTYHATDTAVADDVKLVFAYDYKGRRYEKTVYKHDGADWQEQYTKTFVYDGWNLMQESCSVVNSTDTFYNKSYTWGLDLSQTLKGAGGVRGLLRMDLYQSDTYYPVGDANGNITDYVDSDGSVGAHFEYDAFGQVIAESIYADCEDYWFPFRFSSKYEDTETDLNYYGFRYYSPELGRWLNRDPIREGGE